MTAKAVRVEEPVSPPVENKVARNTFVYMIFQLMSWGVTFLSEMIVPRRLGEVGYGQLALAASVSGTVGAFFTLSIENYLIAEIGRDPKDAPQLVRAAWGLRFALFVPMACVTALVFYLIKATPEVTMLGMVGLLAALPLCILGPVRSLMAGTDQAKNASLVDFLAVLSPLLAVPFLHYGPVSLSVAWLVTSIFAVAWLAFRIRKSVPFRPMFDFSLWRTLAMGGLPFLWNETIVKFYEFGSVLTLRHFSGEGAVGEFSRAIKLQGTFLFIPAALSAALLPSLARLADTDRDKFRQMQSKTLGLMISLALPVMAGVITLAEPFCHLLYGHRFAEVPVALRFSALNLIPLYINTVLYRFLVAERKNGIWAYFLFGTVLMNASLCYLLIPMTRSWLGNAPAGAMLASLVAESVTVIAAFIVLKNNPLTGATLQQIGRSALAATGMAVVMWYTRHLWLPVPALLGTFTFLALAWPLKALGAEEQEKLLILLKSRLPFLFRRKRPQLTLR